MRPTSAGCSRLVRELLSPAGWGASPGGPGCSRPSIDALHHSARSSSLASSRTATGPMPNWAVYTRTTFPRTRHGGSVPDLSAPARGRSGALVEKSAGVAAYAGTGHPAASSRCRRSGGWPIDPEIRRSPAASANHAAQAGQSPRSVQAPRARYSRDGRCTAHPPGGAS